VLQPVIAQCGRLLLLLSVLAGVTAAALLVTAVLMYMMSTVTHSVAQQRKSECAIGT
jgi:hypothetical protein